MRHPYTKPANARAKMANSGVPNGSTRQEPRQSTRPATAVRSATHNYYPTLRPAGACQREQGASRRRFEGSKLRTTWCGRGHGPWNGNGRQQRGADGPARFEPDSSHRRFVSAIDLPPIERGAAGCTTPTPFTVEDSATESLRAASQTYWVPETGDRMKPAGNLADAYRAKNPRVLRSRLCRGAARVSRRCSIGRVWQSRPAACRYGRDKLLVDDDPSAWEVGSVVQWRPRDAALGEQTSLPRSPTSVRADRRRSDLVSIVTAPQTRCADPSGAATAAPSVSR